MCGKGQTPFAMVLPTAIMASMNSSAFGQYLRPDVTLAAEYLSSYLIN
jgi:hypothetical protein